MSPYSKPKGRPKYIRKVVKQRTIRDVFHFTCYSNLPGILEHGLLSIEELERRNLPYTPSDSQRRDGRTEAICASISFPNWSMFYRKRRNSEAPQGWIVICLDPAILWKYRVEFYAYNAASEGMLGMDDDRRRRSTAFRSLFEGNNRTTEGGMRLPARYPTQNQAEVLIYDRIRPADIQYCVVGTREIQLEAQQLYPDIEFRLSPLWANGDSARPSVYSQLDYYLRYGGEKRG